MVDIIIYYVVSIVHVRNVQAIAAEMGDYTLRVVYERESPWLNAANMRDIGLETIVFSERDLPEAIWVGRVGGVVFSTVQPRPGPVALLRAAINGGIPTIAIEETNQVALNQGRVNNYVLPVDHVFACSAYERREMIAAGFPDRRFSISGWPFYHGQVGETPIERKRTSREELGLDPQRPVAALTLSGLHDAGESPEVRQRQLTLAAQGLPDDYQLAVKPHPKESLQTLVPFVEKFAPEAKVIDGLVSINTLLDAADILLNRGVSQVCIEALFQKIPVLVLETGISTPFHGVVEDLIASNPEDLHRLVETIRNGANWLDMYESFFGEHVPHGPLEARSLACRRIAEIARNRERDPARGEQLFELALYQAWVGDREGARQTAADPEVVAAECPAGQLRRLIGFDAEPRDITDLREYIGSGFKSHFLRCLWIDQITAAGLDPNEDDVAWMEDFPPLAQPVWFVPRARAWVLHLARRGRRERAEEFAAKVYREFPDTVGVERLRRDTETYFKGGVGRARVALRDKAVEILRPLRNRLVEMTR
jgi:hypothetical protein